MQIIKLGGSVITDKKRYRLFRQKATEKIVSELRKVKESGENFIVVHGAGSFGHIKAKEYKLQLGKNQSFKDQDKGFARVHLDVRSLNLRIMKIFNSFSIPAISLAPISFALNKRGKLVSLSFEQFEKALENSLTPVTFGDVIFDQEIGFSICSGDDLALSLAAHFSPSRLIFLCDVPGIYSDFPPKAGSSILPEISAEFLSNLRESGSVSDVTGGMLGKVQKCFDILAGKKDVEVWIVSGKDIENIRNALIGKDIQGTKVVIK